MNLNHLYSGGKKHAADKMPMKGAMPTKPKGKKLGRQASMALDMAKKARGGK